MLISCSVERNVTIENIETFVKEKFFPNDSVTANLKNIAKELSQLEDVAEVFGDCDIFYEV